LSGLAELGVSFREVTMRQVNRFEDLKVFIRKREQKPISNITPVDNIS
jgi:hypothetical protein